MSALVPALFILAILICAFIGMTETKVKEEVNKKLDQDIGRDPGSESVH